MFALFFTALLFATAVAAAGALADSGLRWWSAFGRLRGEARLAVAVQTHVSANRPGFLLGSLSASGRPAGQRRLGQPELRRAA